MHHGDLRQAHGRHTCLVGEAARAFDENLRGVIEIGAATFGEGDDRQFVFHGDLLQAQGLVQAAGEIVPPLIALLLTTTSTRTPDT